MPKAAKKSNRVARHPRAQLKPATSCPVEKLAIEVGELWDAFNGAQAEDKWIARQIEDNRRALEELTSFQRARSLAGAMFQIVLAQHEVGDMFSHLTEEEQKNHQDLDDRIERLLDSAVAAIRDVLGDDFAPLENVMRVYGCVRDEPPIPWLDDVPQLAEEGRKAEREPKMRAARSAELMEA
jgi:hypothetical protein